MPTVPPTVATTEQCGKSMLTSGMFEIVIEIVALRAHCVHLPGNSPKIKTCLLAQQSSKAHKITTNT